MNITLAGKTALITGSTSGMGYAAALALAASGAKVVLNGRTEQHVASARQRLKQALPDADVQGVAADVGEQEALDRLIARPVEEILDSSKRAQHRHGADAVRLQIWREHSF
jgi:NAD(P)-dependent dehydrogenase (short-subunit alcohol dehydrogenase family)